MIVSLSPLLFSYPHPVFSIRVSQKNHLVTCHMDPLLRYGIINYNDIQGRKEDLSFTKIYIIVCTSKLKLHHCQSSHPVSLWEHFPRVTCEDHLPAHDIPNKEWLNRLWIWGVGKIKARSDQPMDSSLVFLQRRRYILQPGFYWRSFFYLKFPSPWFSCLGLLQFQTQLGKNNTRCQPPFKMSILLKEGRTLP